jgi:hypothetical protein
MVENGYYKVTDSYFDFFSNTFGCVFKFNKGGNRPVFCCFEDTKVKGLYWAVPTGNAANKDLSRIQAYMNQPKDKIGRSYYHLGHTNKPAIFYISSSFPITVKYISGEYESQGIHLITRDAIQNREIRSKLRNIIAYETIHANHFEQRITDIKNFLTVDLMVK